MRQVAPSTSAFDGLLENVELKTSAGSRTGTQTLHQLALVAPQALSCYDRRHGRNSCRHDKEEHYTSRQGLLEKAEGHTEWRGTDISCTRHARQLRAAASGPLLACEKLHAQGAAGHRSAAPAAPRASVCALQQGAPKMTPTAANASPNVATQPDFCGPRRALPSAAMWQAARSHRPRRSQGAVLADQRMTWPPDPRRQQRWRPVSRWSPLRPGPSACRPGPCPGSMPGWTRSARAGPARRRLCRPEA